MGFIATALVALVAAFSAIDVAASKRDRRRRR